MPRALFIVTTDPRISARPAEAVRIAAGVGVWGKVEILFHLCGPATQMLGEFAEELVDGENFIRYLPLLTETGRAIQVQPGSVAPDKPVHPQLKFVEIDDEELARQAAESQFVLRF